MILMTLFSFSLLLLLVLYKRNSVDLEISGHVFKRKVPLRITDTWKRDLRNNAVKLDTTLVGNHEMMAFFIVENIQDYRKTIY